MVEKWAIPPDVEYRMQLIARELRKNPTPSEHLLWQEIRYKKLGGRKFRRQVAIGAFVVDFYCSSENLVVEVDGGIHDKRQEADHIRQEMIESLGIRFLRFRNDEVIHNLAFVLQTIQTSFGTQ